jgi:hypothetical protein
MTPAMKKCMKCGKTAAEAKNCKSKDCPMAKMMTMKKPAKKMGKY